MKYVNKSTGESISVATFNQLTPTAQSNFALDVSTPQPQVTHQIVEHRSDSLSIGDAVVGVAVLPLVIFGELFG